MNSSAPKNLLAVLEIQVLSFVLNSSRPFLLPYIPTKFVLASWNSLLCLFGRGDAHLIQSCKSRFVGVPFVIKNQPQNGVLSDYFFAADSATERTGLTVLGVASVTVVSSFLIASSKYSMIIFAVTSTTTTVPFLRVMLLLRYFKTRCGLSSGFSCFWVILGGFCKNHFLQNKK